MTTFKRLLLNLLLLTAVATIYTSCEVEDGIDGIDGADGVNGQDGADGEDGEDFTPEPEMFSDKSNLKALVAMKPQFNYVNAYSILSSSDTLSNDFKLVGAQDGAGFLKDPDSDGYIYIVNAEDTYAVSRIMLDKNLNPISGEWLLNSSVADYARQCSGTMWEAAIHGGSQDLFLSASESINYDVKGIDPYMTPTPGADFGLDALGEFSWENAVPLPQVAFPGKTVIIGGDDDSSGSEGQVSLYLSENGDDDLENGKIYALRFKEVSDNNGGKMAVTSGQIYNESNLDFQETYDVEFVEIPNGKNLTKNEMEDACVAVQASAFMRVEDVDYQKGSADNNRNVYFAVTGRGPGAGTYNDWGTVYKLELDANNPLEGQLTQIVSGNTNTNNADGNLSELQSPDNICVTENFVYFQEDPNSFSRGHSAYIYQSDLNGNNTQQVLEFVVRQDLAEDGSTGFSGEYGALIDISDKVGVPGTFILNLQPHYWRDDSFKGRDGHTFTDGTYEDNQGGQIVLLEGLPK
ncbi:hypothetical protein [Mesonia mobilis]|uniref:Uncharacterized protein n=1 Tax=Mesonia mobilis TaxID=369791 RepID=A0ABQ3BRQ5_9FLAO|nr:hypothetical protein [Mesonia mobilis]MBQ0737589.1 hypothetical protein [Aquimarina celericrescens]GGZ55434.1 hypothetical protein GCM10008088_16260 [Mesonia mobilis]